tara:strand:- start:164 stop:571 length:408 start_codon:yes stop_codon:yes gene_type:complete
MLLAILLTLVWPLLSVAAVPVQEHFEATEQEILDPEEIWIMSINVCRTVPPEIEQAYKKGQLAGINPLWFSPPCKWFALGAVTLNPIPEDLAVWPTLKACLAVPVNIKEGFYLRIRYCQPLTDSADKATMQKESL